MKIGRSLLKSLLLIGAMLLPVACVDYGTRPEGSNDGQSVRSSVCASCRGSGRCRTCNGTGRFLGSGQSGCSTCSSSGVCINCGGNGHW